MSNLPVILVVDDEDQLRKLLEITLSSSDFRVSLASTAKEAVMMVANHPPDLILLDLGLPDRSGQDLLKHLREWYKKPIIVISVQSSEEEIVSALDNGANDYIIKPFRAGELVARVKSAIRNAMIHENKTETRFENLSIDFVSRVVKKGDGIIKLTATEYSLLSLMIRNEGKVLTHQYLLNEVWGRAAQHESQYLRVYVAQLRKKIEDDPNRPTHIVTESGIGYRFIGNTSSN
jgi:two-component system, OmpR family, KDP operon response regulator KdpE